MADTNTDPAALPPRRRNIVLRTLVLVALAAGMALVVIYRDQIDYQVIAEIRAFDIRVDGGGRASVEIFVKLLNDRNGVVRASRTFEASAPVSGAGNDAYIAALDRAFGEAANQIVDWTESTI